MKTTTTSKQTLQLYWHHIWRYPRYVFALLFILPVSVVVSNYLPPLIIATVLRRLAAHDYVPHQIWQSFGPYLIWYVVLLGISVITWRIMDAFAWRLEAGVERDIAERVYDHLLDESANFHANHFGGSLVSQTNKLLGSYIRFADTTMFQVIQLVVGLIATALILITRVPLFVMTLVTFSVAYMVIAIFITRKVRALSSKQAAAESAQTGYLADSVTNVMAIKSFAGGKFERQAFAQRTNKTRQRTLSVMRASRTQMIWLGSMNSTINSLALVAAVIAVMVFNANVATVYLIFIYTSSIVGQLFTFSTNTLRNYNRALGDAAEMTEILQEIPEVLDPEQPEKSRVKDGRIEFKAVDFTHQDAGEALFDKLNLKIEPGERIGLVGHSGSGKTTFTRLLLRFSDIDGGEILVDGQNIAHLTQDDLRRHIAYVPQEPIMFHRSLTENIRYGDQSASDAQVLKAAKVAHADEFIERLPKGYETLVGERGVKLSGGQRQRIAIARAMLKNAPILVLDEATSALDSESEKLIQDALWKLMQGRTAIVIAHRLSTIQKMDRIVVLEDGEIAEQGTHAELIKHKGVYAELWAHQSGGFLED